MLGRPVYAPERDAWRAVESKVAAVAWFDRSGVARASCDPVRIMPFLEGIPCGVNALVLPDGVAVGRPMEMVVLRSGTHYYGCASFWDPPDADRETMREAARRVGHTLQRELGYRGAVTLDGVMSARGFVPTEINTRTGEGLTVLGSVDERFALDLLAQLVVAGQAHGVGAAALERALLALADRQRTGYGRSVVQQPWETDRSWDAVFEGGAYRLATEGEPAHAVLWLHAMQPRGFLRFVLDPHHTPVGPSVAPRIAAGLALADRVLGLSFGALEAARDLGVPHPT